jgi:TetR/AcrR family transcriptional regulator, tetracycline repressor protein
VATRLDRASVVEAALRLLNETGLEGLSLRRIATELEVKAPALYWHFDSKQALLDEMATEIFRRMLRSTGVGGAGGGAAEEAPHWREWMAAAMRGLRATLLSYRDGAKVFSGSTFTGDEHAAPLQRSMEALARQGFTVTAAARAWSTAYSFTIGFVIEEQAVYPRPGERDPRYDLRARAERMGDANPFAAAVGETLFTDYDQGFEEGLAIVINGIAATCRPDRAAPA